MAAAGNPVAGMEPALAPLQRTGAVIMEITERWSDRVTDLTVANLGDLASAGIGLTMAWIGATRRTLFGALMAVGGVALAVRGITKVYRALGRGEDDRPYDELEYTDADDAANIQRIRDSSPDLFNGENQGEGDRRAARSYNDHLRAFIEDDLVDDAARDAADSLDDTYGR
jgi:hypothetical protein